MPMASERLALVKSAIAARGPIDTQLREGPSDTTSVAACPDHRSRWDDNGLD